MKKCISIILVIMISICLLGCEKNINQNKIGKIKPPANNSLSIKGIWEIIDCKVLDKTVYNEENNKVSVGENIKIALDYIVLGNMEYNNVTYKLKLVKDDYVISYEVKYTIKDLGINKEKTEVISVNSNNGVIFEFIKENYNSGFIFYNGALYKVKFIGEINDSNEKQNNIEDKLDNKVNNQYDSSVGVYLGIKSKIFNEDSGNQIDEKYKTLYIEFKDNNLEAIKEKDEIIAPRMNGIWSINKKTVEINNYHHEYFETHPIDGKSEKENIKNTPKEIKENGYRSINYVGNDYIATEVYKGENFNGNYNKYEVIPIDNINSELPIVISDVFSSEANDIFKQTYEKLMDTLPEKEVEKYSKYINYSNFSVKRNKGKWDIIGKVSSAYNQEGEGHDFSLNIKSSKKLINYDSLLIPWKTLKSEVPLAKDAFTSPNNRIAIVITNDKILVYEIINSKLGDTPLTSIDINKNDEIIMSEWCIGDYVDKWEKPFLD
ncbi:hypothetical protein [Clostridium weizhouense]|uniref:Lipoprotein n=1 Tax=Clostridium weizhouense TaxID=2859781 RepID=A0ABS7AJX2_9CLOT|nr:hypothetical protein [Clostridium weizhouense]MBW6408947.1 hypothetical protein [Clostridium weizhouense]